MTQLESLFQQFLQERTYLKNVTPKTRVWYESAWRALPPGVVSGVVLGHSTSAADSGEVTKWCRVSGLPSPARATRRS
jgi:hypothetical protein